MERRGTTPPTDTSLSITFLQVIVAGKVSNKQSHAEITSYLDNWIPKSSLNSIFNTQSSMCKMWEKIRFGVRWRVGERTALAMRGVDLKNVQSIHFSFDPFHPGCGSLRTFWFLLSSPYVRKTNPSTKIDCDVRNDRQPPYFYANLCDGKKLLFRTNGMHTMDLVMTFNRLLGNPEFGKSGIRPLPKID